MNAEQMKGKWKLKGSVKTKWGKLTDDDVEVINGQRDQLIGRIQERYGIAKEQEPRQIRSSQACKSRTIKRMQPKVLSIASFPSCASPQTGKVGLTGGCFAHFPAYDCHPQIKTVFPIDYENSTMRLPFSGCKYRSFGRA